MKKKHAQAHTAECVFKCSHFKFQNKRVLNLLMQINE